MVISESLKCGHDRSLGSVVPLTDVDRGAEGLGGSVRDAAAREAPGRSSYGDL